MVVPVSKFFSRPFRPQFGLKIRGGVRGGGGGFSPGSPLVSVCKY